MAEEQQPSKDVAGGADGLSHHGVLRNTKFKDDGHSDSDIGKFVKEEPRQLNFIPMLFDRINEKAIDMCVKFIKTTEAALAWSERVPLQHTTEKPTIHLRKRGIVTREDVYLLLLIDVDYSSYAENEAKSLYLQWMVQDVRLPSGSAEVGKPVLAISSGGIYRNSFRFPLRALKSFSVKRRNALLPDVVNRLGREVVKYTPRGTAGAAHGHVFLLYQQEKSLSRDVAGRIQREGFEPKEFLISEKFRHPDPALVFYYETQ